MLASIVLAAAAAAFSPGFDGADLICRPGGGAQLVVWRGDEARPERAASQVAPGGSAFRVSLSDWKIHVLPLAGRTAEFGLQVIDDATPGFTRTSSTLLTCGRNGNGPLRLRLRPRAVASVDQASRLR